MTILTVPLSFRLSMIGGDLVNTRSRACSLSQFVSHLLHALSVAPVWPSSSLVLVLSLVSCLMFFPGMSQKECHHFEWCINFQTCLGKWKDLLVNYPSPQSMCSVSAAQKRGSSDSQDVWASDITKTSLGESAVLLEVGRVESVECLLELLSLLSVSWDDLTDLLLVLLEVCDLRGVERVELVGLDLFVKSVKLLKDDFQLNEILLDFLDILLGFSFLKLDLGSLAEGDTPLDEANALGDI